MRRSFCLLAVATAVLAIPMAEAASQPGVSLSVTTFKTYYGKSILLSGRVTTHKAGVAVDVMARSFTQSGFVRLAAVTTGEGGYWSYRARPAIATTYMAKLGERTSRPLTVGVHPKLTLTTLGGGRLQAHATAARSFAGQIVKLQLETPTGWSTLAQLRLNANSSALVPASAVPSGRKTLRLAMSVNQAGVGYLGAFSPPLVRPAHWVSLALSSPEIVAGQSLTLAGRLSVKQVGVPLMIMSRPISQPEFQMLATVKTGAGGRWSFRTSPGIGRAYQAQYGSAKSLVVAVGVHPAIETRILSGGRLWTQVTAGTSFKGSAVQVQRLTEGKWLTIAKRPLNGRSVAVFPVTTLPGGTSTLRVAISVNQAGPGYLGAFGPSFVYQR
jgi:hypothetical protein